MRGSGGDYEAIEPDILFEGVAAPPSSSLDGWHGDTLFGHISDFSYSYGMGVETGRVQPFLLRQGFDSIF